MTPLGFLVAAVIIALVIILLFSGPIAYYSAKFLNRLESDVDSANKTFDETRKEN